MAIGRPLKRSSIKPAGRPVSIARARAPEMNELASREASRIRRFCRAGIMTGMAAAVTISMIVITINKSSSVTPRERDGCFLDAGRQVPMRLPRCDHVVVDVVDPGTGNEVWLSGFVARSADHA